MRDLDWLNVEVGDALVDPHTGVRREVLSVKRHTGKQGYPTRTSVRVTNLKQRSRTTIRARCLRLEKQPMAGAIEYRDPGDEQP